MAAAFYCTLVAASTNTQQNVMGLDSFSIYIINFIMLLTPRAPWQPSLRDQEFIKNSLNPCQQGQQARSKERRGLGGWNCGTPSWWLRYFTYSKGVLLSLVGFSPYRLSRQHSFARPSHWLNAMIASLGNKFRITRLAKGIEINFSASISFRLAVYLTPWYGGVIATLIYGV